MTGFPWLLLVVGLLAVAVCLLREARHLDWGQWPRRLGWWVTLTNAGDRWGFRIQWERVPLCHPRGGKFYRPWLAWPATYVLSYHGVTLFVYLGDIGRRRNSESTSKNNTPEETQE